MPSPSWLRAASLSAPPEELRCAGELARAHHPEQVAGRGHQMLRGGDVSRRTGEPARDVEPGAAHVRHRGALLARDRQMLELGEHHRDQAGGRLGVVLAVALVDEQLVEAARQPRAQQPAVVTVDERRLPIEAGGDVIEPGAPLGETLHLGGAKGLARRFQLAVVSRDTEIRRRHRIDGGGRVDDVLREADELLVRGLCARAAGRQRQHRRQSVDPCSVHGAPVEARAGTRVRGRLCCQRAC
ncbi:MAG: hypothetical protein KGJ68_11310 [Gammaproteobacteria bacterium]|nr:hypothetical protein [Gammaproteobacteria bacterium]